jgi:hypothetical protein
MLRTCLSSFRTFITRSPTIPNLSMQDTHTFSEAEQLVMRFERLLKSINIEIRRGSVLETLCLNTIDLYHKHEHPEIRPGDSIDVRPRYREMVGLFDLLVKLVSCEGHRAFSRLTPHLRLLNDGNPLQSVTTSVLDQENNKLFELYIASLCIGIPVEDVLLDDPNASVGDNPDVLATYEGVRWGLACKALHSAAPKTIMDNIRKAIDQIERSGADTGFPVLSAKNIAAHDEIWPMRPEAQLTGEPSDALIFFSYPTTDVPVQMLRAYATRIRDELVKEFGQEELLAAFAGRKAQPACLIYLPSTASVMHNGQPVATRLNVLQVLPIQELEPAAMQFVRALHERLQRSSPD